MVTLCLVLFVDVAVSPLMVPVDVALGFAVGVFIGRSRWVLRALIPASRRRRVALLAARAEFVAEAVHATPQRSGILIYVSALEGEVLAVCDVGIEGLVPQGELRRVTDKLRATSLADLVAGIEGLGVLMGAYVPPLPTSADRIELDDAPRIRP